MMRINRLFVSFFLLLGAVCHLSAQGELQPLPIDKHIRYGKLPNGMTYYIRHNELPKERADFYIAQNVGSMLEEENQRGLAHFLEHMAFNGSKNFPNDGMDEYLESVGMRMGENLNAYTSFDETVYMIMNAPVTRTGVIDSCLLVLHDWSNYLALTDSAVEKERGIIREEWRTGQDAQSRLWEVQLPKMYPGSRYANRIPIGTIDVINNFKPDELRDYYHKWYRPDLQALIVVGDIDVDKVEAAIKQLFTDIPAPVNPAPRIEFEVPDNDLPLVSIATDKEAPQTILYIFYKHDKMPRELTSTINGLVKDYVQQVASMMMNERFNELLQKANPPFVYAEAGDGEYMIARTKDAWTVAALAKEGEIDSTLTAMVIETERLRQHGFTASEYDRARINLLKQYESAFNERDKQKNNTYTHAYVSHFTSGGYLLDIADEYELINQIAPMIPVEQVNGYIQDMIGEDNIVLALTGPAKEGLKYPSEEDLLRTFLKARQLPVDAYVETVSNEPLIPTLPTPGKITSTTEDARFGATVLALSNGVRVILKPTEYKKDEILMTATSPGGSTLFGKEDVYNLMVMNNVIGLGGLGQFSATDLSKRLAGKQVSCSSSVGEDNESLNGSSSVRDLQTLFELIYLHFTALRSDTEAYASFETRMKAQLANVELDPMTAFSDTLTQAVYKDDPRAQRLRIRDFEHISYPRILEMYKQRFADASDFTFTFVGNIDPEVIRPLLEQYLATLPSIRRVEKGDVSKEPPMRKGTYVNDFTRQMEVPKATVLDLYSGQMAYTLEESVSATMLKQILDLVYTEKIREEQGGTYGVSVSAGIAGFPSGQTTLQIFFDTDPAKRKQLAAVIHNELNRIVEAGPRPTDFQKTQDNLLKRHAERMQENAYWLNVIDNCYFRGLDAYTAYEATVKAMTPEKIRAFAGKFIKQGNHIEVVMEP